MKQNQTSQNTQFLNGKLLPITEIFRTIQGEGSLVGTPSIFVRTNFCNLRCHWCDTPYTSHEPEKADKMSTYQIVNRVEHLARLEKGHCRGSQVGYVVITGGEPMMWNKPLIDLVDELREHAFHITIETNGTIYQPVNEFCLMSISPKLASSAPKYQNERRQNKWFARHNATRIDMDVLKLFVDDARYYQLKFVISDRNEMEEVLPLLDSLNANRNKVYLMPEGKTREHVKVNAEMVWNLAIKYGLRYSPRLQVDLFDDKRGM